MYVTKWVDQTVLLYTISNICRTPIRKMSCKPFSSDKRSTSGPASLDQVHLRSVCPRFKMFASRIVCDVPFGHPLISPGWACLARVQEVLPTSISYLLQRNDPVFLGYCHHLAVDDQQLLIILSRPLGQASLRGNRSAEISGAFVICCRDKIAEPRPIFFRALMVKTAERLVEIHK